MPDHLLRYDAADWPHPVCHPECAFWEAVSLWRRMHPSDLDDPRSDAGPLVVDGPDVPFALQWVGTQLIDTAHNQVI